MKSPRLPYELEMMEARILLSAAVLPCFKFEGPMQRQRAGEPTAHTTFTINPYKKTVATPHAATPPGSALTPQQLRAAYGLTDLTYSGTAADGTGQIIAIVIAYHYPT